MAFTMSYGEPPAAAAKAPLANDVAAPAKRAKRSSPTRKAPASRDEHAAPETADIKDAPPG